MPSLLGSLLQLFCIRMNLVNADDYRKYKTCNMCPPVEGSAVRRIGHKGGNAEVNQAGHNKQPPSEPVGRMPKLLIGKCLSGPHSVKPVPGDFAYGERCRDDQKND